MTKAKKVVLAQPAATAPPLLLPRPTGHARGSAGGGGEAHRARARYHNLLQDYQELLKETEAKKKRLHMEKLKKQRLMAEVKFLRRRYRSLSENPSQTVVYRLKNPAMPPVLPHTAWAPHDQDRRPPAHAIGSSSRGPSSHRRLESAPRASPVIDLNEACELSSEEMEEIHGYQEPLRVDRAKKYPIEGDVGAGPSDAKMAAAFWDVRNSAARAGKRKISWQDQLALRV